MFAKCTLITRSYCAKNIIFSESSIIETFQMFFVPFSQQNTDLTTLMVFQIERDLNLVQNQTCITICICLHLPVPVFGHLD